jgi:hypothetical protein
VLVGEEGFLGDWPVVSVEEELDHRIVSMRVVKEGVVGFVVVERLLIALREFVRMSSGAVTWIYNDFLV